MRLWKRTRDEMGEEAREIFDAEPAQDAAMGLCLTAWEDLQTTRASAMDVGPIGWDKAMDWCDRKGLGGPFAELVWAVIQRLDRDFFDRLAASRPAHA